MTRDQVVLLVAVDGFVLAVLIATGTLLWSRPGAAEGAVVAEPERPASQRLLFPMLDGLRSLGLRLSPSGAVATMQRKLDIAGNPQPWSVERIFATKAMGLLVGVLFGLLLGHGLTLRGLMFAAGFGASLFFLPDVLVHNTGIKRQQRIQASLSDVVDLLSVTMKAGLGFDGAVGRVAQVSAGPLAGEFARYLQELRLGRSRAEALRGLAARSTVVELHHIVSALVQADHLGIPVAKVLGQQAHEVRLKRRQRAQERAQKVTIKLVFPTLLCIFPALFVVVIGPGVIQLAQTLFGAGGALDG